MWAPRCERPGDFKAQHSPGLVNSRANSITETPLMVSTVFGKTEMVKILLEYRADPFAIDYRAKNAFELRPRRI